MPRRDDYSIKKIYIRNGDRGRCSHYIWPQTRKGNLLGSVLRTMLTWVYIYEIFKKCSYSPPNLNSLERSKLPSRRQDKKILAVVSMMKFGTVIVIGPECRRQQFSLLLKTLMFISTPDAPSFHNRLNEPRHFGVKPKMTLHYFDLRDRNKVIRTSKSVSLYFLPFFSGTRLELPTAFCSRKSKPLMHHLFGIWPYTLQLKWLVSLQSRRRELQVGPLTRV